MSKKVLILSGSPRKGGNSDILCDEFLRGAQDAGHKAEKIRAAEKKVAPCSGCYYCSTHGGACVHKDDMADILQKMIDADVIVLASPVYFYSISAQLKAVIDRTVARWLEVKDKEFYYITTMADEEKSSADTTLTCRGGFAVPAGRASATEPAQIVLFTLFLGRFTQICFQNAVKYAILKAEKHTPPP